MSSSDPWSIVNWQCGMGVATSCSDQVINWDEPRSWQSVMDQLMPIIELALVFGLQYAAASTGDGAVKAMNSLRCMFNSVVTTTWAYAAGAWQFIKYIGQDGAIKTYLDQGYGYVCTCLIDLNGIKAALGTSASSNAAFSSCSEHAQYERIKARQAQETAEDNKESAAEQALLDAARKLKAWQTVNVLKRKANCAAAAGSTHPTLPTPAVDADTTYDQAKAEFDYNTTPWVPTNLAGCEADVLTFETEAKLIHYYWLVKTWSSGGLGSHRNKEEQTNLQTSEWVLQGVANMKNILYPNTTKYDLYGHEITCTAGSGTGTSGACKATMDQYVIDQNAASDPDVLAGYFYSHNSAIQCYDGNVSTGTSYTVEATNNELNACALVPLKYGYYRWMDNGSIVCGTAPSQQTGFKFCKFDLTTETWQLRSAAPSDAWSSTDDMYRTLGSTVASITTTTTTAADGTTSSTTNTVEGSVRDQDVKCYYFNGSSHTISQGAANCFAVKIEGSSIRVGTQTGSAALAINESYYQWLYGGSASCAAGLTLANCSPTLTWDAACTVSAVNKLRFNSGTTTICTTSAPSITWADITASS